MAIIKLYLKKELFRLNAGVKNISLIKANFKHKVNQSIKQIFDCIT
jgi:hypothetical protein